MKKQQFFVALVLTFMMFALTISVSADNDTLVPYSGGAITSVTESSPSITTQSNVDKAKEYFSSSSMLDDPSYDQTVSNVSTFLADITKIVINILFAAFPLLSALQFFIDVFCILFNPINILMAKYMPMRFFSKEVEGITGVPFTGSGNNGQSGEGISASTTEKTDLKGKSPIMYYLTTRVKLYIFCVILLVMVGTGLWMSIMNLITDWVLGIFAGFGI